MKKHSPEYLHNLTPYQGYELLVEGNKRFIGSLRKDHDHLEMINETREGQYPFAVILSCMDSRTSVELIFDQGLGDIFSIRIAGNVVNDDIIGSMEYACAAAGSKLIVVLGHTRCGAVKGACDHVKLGNLTGLLDKIQPSLDKTSAARDTVSPAEYTEVVAQANVLHSMDEVMERSEILRNLFNEGKIGIVGGIYSVENGRVNFIRSEFSAQPAGQTKATVTA